VIDRNKSPLSSYDTYESKGAGLGAKMMRTVPDLPFSFEMLDEFKTY
jgi:hypothetical protein